MAHAAFRSKNRFTSFQIAHGSSINGNGTDKNDNDDQSSHLSLRIGCPGGFLVAKKQGKRVNQ
jgi:hypothetical protein